MINLNFHPFPVLSTERLSLRSFTKNDANDLFVVRSDENVMQFIDRPMAKTVNDTLDYIIRMQESLKNNFGITWAICCKENNHVIGTIGFWRIIPENYRAEIGYLLHADYHRKGLMQEAIKTVLNYGFSKMNLHSVEAVVKPGNNASIKLLEKNGFVKEAYFKENYYYNGKFLDSIVYSLLSQNYHLNK